MQMERSNDSRLKEDELETNILEIKTDKVRAIVDVIKAISFKETATLDVLNKGFRIIVDDMGMCQAVAYLESTIFQSYARSENFKFDIPLRALTESLSLLDGQGQVFQMKYAKDDIYLDCILEVDGVVIGSRIRILDTDEQSTGNFVFDSNVVVARVMMRTALIHDLFKDMDTSSSALFIEVNKTGISFITIGDMGKVTTTIPSKSVLMDAIDCPVPIRHRYRMGMMRRMTQALSIAEKVSLRFDSEGVLGAQFIIRHESCGEGNEIFTEFFLKRLLRDVNYGGGNRASSMSTSKSQSSDDNALNANANFYGVDPCDLSGDSIVSKLKTWLKDKQVLPNDLQGEYSRLDAYKLAIDKVLQSMTVIMEENPEQRKNLNDANMHCVPSTPDNDNYARVSTFLSNYLSTCEKNKDQAKRVGKLENTSEVQRICRELARIKVDYLTKMRKAVREIRNFVRTEYWSMVEVKKDVMISMHELEYARSGKSKNSDDDENRLRMAEQVVEKKLEDSRRNVATLDGLQDKHMDAILKWMAIKVGYHRKMCEAIDVKRT